MDVDAADEINTFSMNHMLIIYGLTDSEFIIFSNEMKRFVIPDMLTNQTSDQFDIPVYDEIGLNQDQLSRSLGTLKSLDTQSKAQQVYHKILQERQLETRSATDLQTNSFYKNNKTNKNKLSQTSDESVFKRSRNK